MLRNSPGHYLLEIPVNLSQYWWSVGLFNNRNFSVQSKFSHFTYLSDDDEDDDDDNNNNNNNNLAQQGPSSNFLDRKTLVVIMQLLSLVSERNVLARDWDSNAVLSIKWTKG